MRSYSAPELAALQTRSGYVARALFWIQVRDRSTNARVGFGFWAGEDANMTMAQGSEVVITRDPAATKATAIVQLSSVIDWVANIGTGGCQIRFKGLTFNRTAAGDISGVSGSWLFCVFDDVAFNNSSLNSIFVWDYCALFWLGVTFSNAGSAASFWGEPPNVNRQITGFRGCTGACSSPSPFLMLGNNFSGIPGTSYGTKAQGGTFIGFNKFMSATLFMDIVPSNQTNIAIIQNLIEITNSAASVALGIVGLGTLDHVLVWGNTVTGHFSVGRTNLFYDQQTGSCVSTFCSTRGNNWTQLNTKSDVFDTNGARIGNWAFMYGVECAGDFSRFIDATSGGIGGSFAQAYPGLNASLGTSSTVANDPLFTNYQGVTAGPTSGAGGGTYTLQSGSPADSRKAAHALTFDLAGVARSAALPTSGAYELAAATVTGDAAGSIALDGTGAGGAKAAGAAAGALPLTGAGAGASPAVAAGAGSIPLTGAGEGLAPAAAVAAGTIPLTGAGDGSGGSPTGGVVLGTLPLGGVAVGAAKVSGIAAGDLPLGGNAVATTPDLASVAGVGVGDLDVAGSGQGKAAVRGDAVSSIALTGSSSPTPLIDWDRLLATHIPTRLCAHAEPIAFLADARPFKLLETAA